MSTVLFDQVLAGLRPQMHRYCSRMTGSVIDGEDVVQDAIVNALSADGIPETRGHMEAWLFRIAHNAAIDFLRRRNRSDAIHSDEELDMIPDPSAHLDTRGTAAASLRLFLQLSPLQRSAVVMKDVLGYSLQEIGNMTGASVLSVKAALHRGRTRLRGLAGEFGQDASLPSEPRHAVDDAERARLKQYVDLFNARDFDALRDLLASDVRLDLVAHRTIDGKATSSYFGNYAAISNWRFVAGLVDGHPAVLVVDPEDADGPPRYFILLDWAGDKVSAIRDFVFARYVMDGADIQRLGYTDR